jgi:hypothetical protein
LRDEAESFSVTPSPKAKAAEHRSAAWRIMSIPRNLKVLTAPPQYEARAFIYFDLLFAFFFFFFVAMALFLRVSVNVRQGWFKSRV